MEKHLLFIILLTIFSSCDSNHQAEQKGVLNKMVLQGETQGTYYAITYYDRENRYLKPQIDSLLHVFDMSASNYEDSSFISKINSNTDYYADDIVIGNIELAQEISILTGGQFDLTVRPLVELWGFGKNKPSDVSKEQVDSILQFVGYKKIAIDGHRIIKSDPRVQIDFDAIAQGYAVDYLGSYFHSLGIDNFLIDIGGEILGNGMKSDSTFWKVGVERPKDNEAYGEALSAVVILDNRAIATSGNYRKFYEKDGVRYSHTIDPKSGYPIMRNILSATIIAPTAAQADALATSAMVLGVEGFKKLLPELKDVDAFLIYSDSLKHYNFFITDALKPYLDVQ